MGLLVHIQLCCFFLCICSELCGAFETASFYGGSYITIPLQDARSTTEIQLRFRTKQSDALLFLAAGKTDYCLIKLQSGKLKVHINLGAGEPELPPPKGLRLDDLVWHHISLNRKDGEINVTIDKIHTIRGKLPGKYFELNIYDGLFLGGSDDSSDLFLLVGHFEWLRGCLSAVFYNGVDVLKRARNRMLKSDAHGITWSCASEFDSPFSSDISFVEEGAYIALPNPISRTGLRWQFELKTIVENCMLFYNSKLVQGGRTDFIGLEMRNRKLHLIMDMGSGMSEVYNEAVITDGEWHLITIQISPSLLEIIVDGRLNASARVSSRTGNKYLDLSDVVFVGGLELNKRAGALSVGMVSADKSFQGCLRNMEVDSKLLGFPNVRVTQGVLPNCVWSYTCSRGPCIPEATCSQLGVDSFQCTCDRPLCANPNYLSKSPMKLPLPIALEILSLNPVQVMEGENVLITPESINVILDYAKYGIRDSGVTFLITQPPHHGVVTVGSSDVTANIDSNSFFTLLDLTEEKVHYIHDGSENYNDSLVMELKFTASVGYTLPAYLLGKNIFQLSIDVASVNDAPFLFIPSSKVLRLAEGTRKVLTSELLNATDSDNNNAELIYSVLNQPGSNNNGFVAKFEAPNVPLTAFSQEDIDLGRIVYAQVNNMTDEDRIALQVSDGILSSSVSYLRLSVFPLQLTLVNNTGITVAQKSYAIITQHNLAFKTNADDPFLSIKYEIVDFPKYGEIQSLIRIKSYEEVWQRVTSFTDQNILREEIRYIHTTQTNSSFDSFKFKVSTKNIMLPTIYEFRATFVLLRLSVVVNKTVELTDSQIALIRESNLKVATVPLSSNNSNIEYKLIHAPRVATLMLGDRPLKVNNTWLQKDIADNKLYFNLHRRTYSVVEEKILFSISAPQCASFENLQLTFRYTPSDEQKGSVQTTMKTVQVPEGGQQPLLLEYLNVVKENVSSIIFQVLDGPSHGWLDMYDIDHTTIEKRNVTQFANTDLLKQKITYTHDDSESVSDSIYFIAYGAHGENFQFVIELNFEILLKNDNPPYCVVNDGLNVVLDGDRILSEQNLLYADADIDAKPETISYTRRDVPYGSFTLSDPPFNQLFEFTQKDINNGRVMFRHSGLSGNISMWVSDGNTFSEFAFEIRASPPYVKVTNNSKLLLRQGGEAPITTLNLYSTTNINIASHLLKYRIIKGPEMGQVTLRGKSGAVEFTQDDIEKKSLIYRHTGDIKSVKDKFHFEVSVEKVFVEEDFHIRMFPAVYWEPLVLVHNKTLFVDEASDVIITRDDLLVQQAHVPPSDITYFVVELPKYGYLEKEVNGRYMEVNFNYLFHPNSSDDSKDTAITLFDQATVDADKLHYIQVILNQTYDRVVLDATNGIVWLRNIVLNFEIVPEQLYLSGGEIRVDEGDSVKLTPSLFYVYSPYYADKVTEFKVKRFPQHGWIQFIGSTSKAGNISRWSANQLNNRQIQYVHDGSETNNDTMFIIAYAGEKESIAAKVTIFITPVNDEMPVVVNNTGASVWRGGICYINSSFLAVTDRDTPNSNITFVIVSAQAGYLAYFTNMNASVDKFTQSEIDSGKIIFVHSGEEADGEFDIVVNDGRHRMDPITFRVKMMLPTLHVWKNVNFQIFPMLRKAITPHHLLTWCSDTDKNIFYVVKTPPKLGVLSVVDADLTMPISNFSQADVNASRIWYHHNAHAADSTVTNDSFTFDIFAGYAVPIYNEAFNIKIAVSSGGLDGMLDAETYEVEEGSQVKLFANTSNLVSFLSSENVGLRSSSLKAIVLTPPQHGKLCVHENCSVSTFTNEQMNAGIVYKHDDSDSRYDNVTLTLLLEQDNITLCNLSIYIRVNPKNDQDFQLLQDSPNLSIVQNERFVIGPDQLRTVDADSYPEEIVYDVISGPNIGTLWVGGVKGAGKFTQADINAGRLVYEHSGPVQSTSFHFRVSDGHFDPRYKVFNIYVHAAVLSVVVGRPVLLMQGSNSTHISANIFNVQTNQRAGDVTYRVTTEPQYGYIMVNGSTNPTFNQTDLRMKRVTYVQSDLSVPADAFELEATLAVVADSTRARNLWVNVSVEPLLVIGHFSPVAGVRNCIDEDVLNAAALLHKSPEFVVVKKPKYGKLQKIIKRERKQSGKSSRESRTVKQVDIDKFTFEEVSSKVIYYVAKKLNYSVEDGFAFLLTARSAQPANGELRFHVSPESSRSPSSWGAAGGNGTGNAPKQRWPPKSQKPQQPSTSGGGGGGSPADASYDGDETDVEIASPNITSDYYLVISLLLGVLIVSLMFVVLVRCRSKKQAEEDLKNSSLPPPLPLPRPPDDLLPASPYPKQRNNNLLQAAPQCKVMPLGTDSMTSSEHDFNLRYPYGAADEDWSSYDTNGYSGRTNNPMLRKNQYWV